MNKNPISKAANAGIPDTAVAAKAAPAATKAATTNAAKTGRGAKAATAVAPAKSDMSAKAARTGRPPSAKTAMAKKAPAASTSRAAKAAETKVVAAVPTAAKSAAAAKEKAKKAKLVRDSFTMPETEYAILGKAKKASLKAGFNVKKSELLRIGVALVDQLSMAQLQAALAALMPVKAGRPKKDK